MQPPAALNRPMLARHARYRWDALRQQHQIVFPEGVLVLNESGAAIVRHCDGRPICEVVAALETEFQDAPLETDGTPKYTKTKSAKGRLTTGQKDHRVQLSTDYADFHRYDPDRASVNL
jgi:pyrroloquinoline quinone biosynthesis protein D